MGSPIFYIVYFGLLLADVILIFTNPEGPWRFVLEPLMIILLIVRFKQRNKTSFTCDPKLVITALGAILLGGLFLLESFPLSSFFAGFCFFMVANLLYTILFYRCADLRMNRAIPFIIVASVIAMTLLYFFYDVLGDYFFPASIFLFILLNALQAAWLRYKVVNDPSFYMVFTGTLLFFIAQVSAALYHFITKNTWLGVFILLTFFTSQILIIKGVLCTDDALGVLAGQQLNPESPPDPVEDKP